MSKVVALPPVIPAVAVDELADLLARSAPMIERIELLKASLKAMGVERIHGTLHDAVIYLSERDIPDTKRLRADLGEEVYKSYCTKSLSVSCKVTARKLV